MFFTNWAILLIVMFLITVHLSVCDTLQNTSVSPDGRLLAVLGDSAECLIADAQSGKVRNCHGSPTKLFPYSPLILIYLTTT